MGRRLAVVLFNLGGPDKPESVQPFLRNLFFDPAIIGVPRLFRWLLAEFISRRRAPIARAIYDNIGGKSPLLAHTQDQAWALKACLIERGYDADVFICMRYWLPMSGSVSEAVKAFDPDDVVLLPLYPQYSTTTSQSSLDDWRRAAAKVGLKAPTQAVCCYPGLPGLIETTARLTEAALDEAAAKTTVAKRILYSAHGLPKRVIEAGDPYQWQVEKSAAAVAARLDATGKTGDVEHVVCYQSRVGPLEWIGPSTEEELERAGRDGVGVILVPIAFVSEHSETLVELDIEYRELAEVEGVPIYIRVPTVLDDRGFIAGLADLVEEANRSDVSIAGEGRMRGCPSHFQRCGCLPGAPACPGY